MIKKLEISFDDFVKLKKYCDKKGIMFLSTLFDHQSIDFLYDLLDIYKIPSGEIIKESDLAIKRPGTGILPKFKEIIIGLKLINDIRQDEPFKWENFK